MPLRLGCKGCSVHASKVQLFMNERLRLQLVEAHQLMPITLMSFIEVSAGA